MPAHPTSHPSETTPVVSVIVPAYNVSLSIRETLESVRAQTYPWFEVLVVDDGSIDDTCDVVETFVAADPRFRLIRQSNQGVGAARNTGLRQARGRYLAPLDADDLWSPQKLELQVECMESAGEQTGLVYCWSHHIDQHGRWLHVLGPVHVEGRVTFPAVLRHFFGNASVPLFRATALKQVGEYLTRAEQRGAQGCEDWDLHLRIAEKFDVRLVPRDLVAYRQTPDCMSSSARRMAQSYGLVMARAQRRNPNLPDRLFQWSAGYFFSYLSRKCHRSNNHAGVLWSVLQAWTADPATWLNGHLYRIGLKSAARMMLPKSSAPVDPFKAALGADAMPSPRARSRLDIFHHIQSRRWAKATAAPGVTTSADRLPLVGPAYVSAPTT